MLRMKKTCESCRATLADTTPAFICSYECTYCSDCAELMAECPNCAGEIVRRPTRTTGAAAITVRLPGRMTRRIRDIVHR